MDNCNNITKMSVFDLMEKLTDEQKDGIYREVLYQYTVEDVKGFLEDYDAYDIPDTQEEVDNFVGDVAYRYVFNGDRDCNLSYWDNIKNLVDEEMIYAD